MGKMKKVLAELLELLADGDEEMVEKRIKSLRQDGLLVRVDSDEESEFYEDGNPAYTVTTQTNKLVFNNEIVYEWWASYSGFWGGGGTGWWINDDDTDLDSYVEDLLTHLDVEVERPDVPRPPITEDDDED